MTPRFTHPRPHNLRRAFALLFAGVAMAALAACGGSATATPVTTTSTTAAASATSPTAPAAASAASGSATSATRPAATTAPTTSVASAASPATASSPTAAASATGGASASVATVQKVNANTATQAQLLAAFQANGIPNAAQWVREVMEYRPYPTNDPTFAKLRGELAKYNPAPDVVEKIVASLSL